MGDMDAKSGPVEITIEATVIRANGDREDLGVVSYYHKNPVKRAMWALKQKLKESR